jgi:hypothetical protein
MTSYAGSLVGAMTIGACASRNSRSRPSADLEHRKDDAEHQVEALPGADSARSASTVTFSSVIGALALPTHAEAVPGAGDAHALIVAQHEVDRALDRLCCVGRRPKADLRRSG